MNPISTPSLVMIAAPSGCGKTTLCQKLLQDFEKEVVLSISTTTRAPRPGEKNGVHYFFVTHEEFERKIQNQEFAEWAEVHGNRYGTSKVFIEQMVQKNKIVLLDIDVQGAHTLRNSFPHLTWSIFVEAPSFDELRKRILARAPISEEELQKRFQTASQEMQRRGEFTHVIVNDSLERAYSELKNLFTQEVYKKRCP